MHINDGGVESLLASGQFNPASGMVEFKFRLD